MIAGFQLQKAWVWGRGFTGALIVFGAGTILFSHQEKWAAEIERLRSISAEVLRCRSGFGELMVELADAGTRDSIIEAIKNAMDRELRK